MSSKNIFIASFGTFGSYTANSGEQVMKAIAGKRDPTGQFWFYGNTFPATIPEYDRGELVFEMAREYRASGIIALGMASDKRVPTIEHRAQNQNNSRYCESKDNYRWIDGSKSTFNHVRVDLNPWNVDRFIAGSREAGLPEPEISDDAGGFCCNHLIYQMWQTQHREPKPVGIPWIFLHIPCTPEAVPDSLVEEFVLKGKVRTPVPVLLRYLYLLVATATLPEAEELYTSEIILSDR